MYSCLCGKLTDEFTAQMGEYLAHHTSLSTKMTELLMLYKHQMAPMAEIVADREDPMKIKLLFSQDDNGLVVKRLRDELCFEARWKLLSDPDLHPFVRSVYRGERVKEAEIESFQKAGAGGQGDVFLLDDYAIKRCLEYCNGDINPENRLQFT